MPVALGGEEGRDKLRKAAARGKYPHEPPMSEWGNPAAGMPSQRLVRWANAGNGNISVPAGKENNNDSASSGERKRKSPNRGRGDAPPGVVGLPTAIDSSGSRTRREARPQRVTAP